MMDSLSQQRSYWDSWNAENREQAQSEVSRDQRDKAIAWLNRFCRHDLDILEVGCGAGWLCPWLKPYGRVTATDLAPEVLARAQKRITDVRFISGDFMTLDLPGESFDVVVTLEVLSHVGDHSAFVAKLAAVLRPGGALIMATQNRPVLEKHNALQAPQPGQLRKWFDRHELETLLSRHFEISEIQTLTPIAGKGPLRLLAGRQTRRLWRALSGRALENALASRGLGWTLMVRAQKPGAPSIQPPTNT